MADHPETRNDVRGALSGSVVQAGSIQQVTVAGSHDTGQPVVPRQLPLAARGFTGRAEHLAALDGLLPTDDDGAAADTVVISALDGTAGVGKTTLAVHWAHRVQHHFPDGTLHTNLRGYGPGDPATSAEVLDGFLHALGVPPQRIPTSMDARSGLYRSILAGRRVLIVLDNANAASQVRPLLPGSPGCLVLVTSRASLTGLVVNDGATRVTLDLLTPQEATDLVRETVGPQRVEAEPDAIAALIRHCARLPLALRIAAGRAAAQPHLEIANLVTEIADDQRRWDALSLPDDEDTAVRAVFDWSYHRLTTEQARVFRRLGLHPGPDFSPHAAAATTGLEVTQARRVLDVLADAHLVELVARDRYRFHDLLRAYSADRSEHDDQPDERNNARRTLLEWYAHHAKAADRILRPVHHDLNPMLDLYMHVRPEITFTQPVDALAWFDTERNNLIAAAHDSERHDLPQLTFALVDVVVGILFRWGRWDDALPIGQLGLAAAHRLGDRAGECYALIWLGEAHMEVFHGEDAADVFQTAIVLARDLNNPWLEAVALNDLSLICLNEGRYVEAISYLQEALPLSSGVQHGRLEGVIEGNLGKARAGLGHYRQALKHAERSYSLRQQAGDRSGEAVALHIMALVHQGMASHHDVIALCEQALNIEPEHHYPIYTAEILNDLGISLQCTGNSARAVECWREAWKIFDEYGDDRAIEVRHRLHMLEVEAPSHENSSGPG